MRTTCWSALAYLAFALMCPAQMLSSSNTNSVSSGSASGSAGGTGGSTNSLSGVEFVWVGNSLPAGAQVGASAVDTAGAQPSQGSANGPASLTEEGWQWTNAWLAGSAWVYPSSGSRMHVSPPNAGLHEHYFITSGP